MTAPPRPNLAPMLISAPFGNYLHPEGTTPTLGTFTRSARPGRWWRTVKTVRYYPRLQTWVNRIGLRNPGIDWLLERAKTGRVEVSDKVVSIHGFDEEQWQLLLDRVGAMEPAAVELNMSCPNVGEVTWPTDLFDAAARTGVPTIVKLPPINYELMVDQARHAGLVAFHCCNTLPIPAGGLSGAPLKPLSLRCLRSLRATDRGDRLILIGGGGITTQADIDQYAAAGADHVALGTRTMRPALLFRHRSIRPLIDYAHQMLGP